MKYPFIITFSIRQDSSLIINNKQVINSVSNQYLVDVKVDEEQSSDSEFLCYASANKIGTDVNGNAIEIYAISGSASDTSNFNIEWNVNISQEPPLGILCNLNCMDVHNGRIYIAGYADVEKEVNPANGGYWDAGIVGAVSTNGSLEWLKKVILSSYSENYYSLFTTGGIVYAGGNYSSYVKSSSGEMHGLAMISMFDAESGEEIYHIGLGSTEYGSGFYSIYIIGDRAYCGGYTKYYVEDGNFVGWFVEVSLGNLMNSKRSELPLILPVRKGVARSLDVQFEKME